VSPSDSSGAPAGGELQLEAVSGKAAGFTLAVRDRLVFGRQNEGPGRLADDPELSRLHAQIERDPSGQFVLEDLASTNGTWVNGRRIASSTVLAVGDEIELGGSKLVVRAVPAPPPAPDVDVRAATVTGIEAPAALPESGPEPESQPEAKPGADSRIALSLAIDLERGELQILLQDGETLHLLRDRGRWRLAPPPGRG
jgi:pSer/pThr/pTyr-binding forkhead associated (FHA) protein